MDLGLVIGLVVGFGAFLISIVLEKGHFEAYMNLGAFIIIAGGTIGATTISVSLEGMMKLPELLKVLFSSNKKSDPEALIKTICSLANLLRREGVLSLEKEINSIDDKIFKKGLQLIADGTPAQTIADILESEIKALSNRHKKGINIFNLMGGYAPTMGIIGTVLGLVNMLLALGSGGSEGLGHSVAVAFIATLYGIIFANVLFLPMGSNLKIKSEEEVFEKKLVLEGILALQSGENPRMIEEKLRSLIGERTKEKK